MSGRFPIPSRRVMPLLFGAAALWVMASIAPWPWGTTQTVYIRPGSGAREIATLLEKEGIIRSRLLFLLAAFSEGSYTRLKPGEYMLSPRMSLLKVLGKLRKGDVVIHPVVIPEGFTAREIARTLAAQGLADARRFLALAFDRTLPRQHDMEGDSLEGYLFPDTYYLHKGMSEGEIIRMMVARFKRYFGPAEQNRAAALGMTMRETVTLASLIEKEAKVEAERRLISAVFHNRLRQGIPLQADPTVIYALSKFKGKLTRADLAVESPYNTYLHRGLPPGPIANPGRSSLEAALYPARVSFFYFVSRNDGTHFFSSTLGEHERAVRRYRQGG
ncbi:MAG: endolytic transglycosylase MltG [candidate division NC10 bacterium]|nr:endolytic transglycosylase MltG [candidate division NC10 bacterium]